MSYSDEMSSAAPVHDGGEPPPASNEGARRRRRRRRALLPVAVIVVLAVAAYTAWQYYGTGVVAEQRHEGIRAEIREGWEQPTVSDVLGPEAAAPVLGEPLGLVRIPRFGREYEIPLIEGVRSGDLGKGIGHFSGAAPGQIGNVALVAHRVTQGKPFTRLSELRRGDRVIIETADATYTYLLDTSPKDLVLPFTQSWVLDPVPIPPRGQAPPGMPRFSSPEPTRALLTLTTSSEPFSADERMVAFGHLTKVTPKPL